MPGGRCISTEALRQAAGLPPPAVENSWALSVAEIPERLFFLGAALGHLQRVFELGIAGATTRLLVPYTDGTGLVQPPGEGQNGDGAGRLDAFVSLAALNATGKLLAAQDWATIEATRPSAFPGFVHRPLHALVLMQTVPPTLSEAGFFQDESNPCFARLYDGPSQVLLDFPLETMTDFIDPARFFNTYFASSSRQPLVVVVGLRGSGRVVAADLVYRGMFGWLARHVGRHAPTIHLAYANKFYKRIKALSADPPKVLTLRPSAVLLHAAQSVFAARGGGGHTAQCTGVVFRALRSHAINSHTMLERDFGPKFACTLGKLARVLRQWVPPPCLIVATDFTLGPSLSACADPCPPFMATYRAQFWGLLRQEAPRSTMFVFGNSSTSANVVIDPALRATQDPVGFQAWMEFALLFQTQRVVVVGGHFGELIVAARAESPQSLAASTALSDMVFSKLPESLCV